MTERRRLSTEEMHRLARYWFRASLMRGHVHALAKQYEPGLSGLNKDNWWEFETYLMHWLAGLFLLVEGINKLKIQDGRIQKLFNAHIGLLKKARHETYHFAVAQTPVDDTMFKDGRLNWAEELHDAIGEHIKEIALRRANVERFMELRNTKRG
jgi:hypothetical protein